MELFEYEVTLLAGCALFQCEPFKSELLGVSNIVIKSKRFNDYQECVNNAANLVSTLASLLEQVTNEKFVVMSVINPLHNDAVEDKSIAEKEAWQKHTTSRIYAAESAVFKNDNILKFSVFANVNICPEAIEMTYALSSSTLQ